MNSSARSRRLATSGFTLIELLVVISIIAILASLAFPAVNGAIDSARKAQAKNTAVQIAAAVTGYETEYGKLPGGNGTVDLDFVKILTGQDNDENPRKIVFLEAQEWKKGKGGTNANGFCDPWDSETPYSIALDDDYDNEITAGTNSQAIRKKVGVWNIPSGSDSEKKRRYVTSWD